MGFFDDLFGHDKLAGMLKSITFRLKDIQDDIKTNISEEIKKMASNNLEMEARINTQLVALKGGLTDVEGRLSQLANALDIANQNANIDLGPEAQMLTEIVERVRGMAGNVTPVGGPDAAGTDTNVAPAPAAEPTPDPAAPTSPNPGPQPDSTTTSPDMAPGEGTATTPTGTDATGANAPDSTTAPSATPTDTGTQGDVA